MRLDTFVEAFTFEDWNRDERAGLSVEETLIRRLRSMAFTDEEILCALQEPAQYAARTRCAQ